MVDVIDSLEESDQIARVRNPRDRREYSLQLTAKGRRVYQRAQQAVAQAEDDALADLTDSDRHELMNLLRRIAGTGADAASTAYDVIRR